MPGFRKNNLTPQGGLFATPSSIARLQR